MVLHQSQEKIASDEHRFRVVVCGRRFGKSTLDIEEIKGKALVSRERRINKLPISKEEKEQILEMHKVDDYQSRVDYFAPTFEDARDIIWSPLCRELAPVIIGKPNETRLEIVIRNLDGGKSLIKLRSWENIENFRGKKSDFAIFDEVRKYKNFWPNWEEVIRPTLSDYIGEALFNTTPNGFDHVYDLYQMENKDKDFKSFHFTSYDNPFLSKSEIDKAKKEITENRFAQEYLADFRKTEGLVYQGFDRTKHTFTEMPPHLRIDDVLAGVDWGWTNPASSHKYKRDSQRHYWITDEFYKRQKTTSEIIEWVKTYGANKVYPDPAEPDRCEEARNAGLNVQEVSKDIEAGIACVQDLFKQNRIHIHVSCVNLIWELETYSYPEKKPDKNEAELPVKENDHAVDEMRYVLYMQEGHKESIVEYGTTIQDYLI